ncbi:uncharacterized protein [Ptychodera flava]|uniref:uncharacterized protein n=1 Tax=Ptychodera flava TaxID=63121 RepID=UPI00396A55BA
MNILEESMVFQGPVENTTAFGVMLPNQRQLCHQKRDPILQKGLLMTWTHVMLNLLQLAANAVKQLTSKIVSRSHTFNIPLDRVSIPVLHLSLGIFLRFFRMFENACAELDYKILSFQHKHYGEIDEPLLKPAHFDVYAETVRKVLAIEEEAKQCTEKATELGSEIEAAVFDDDDSSDEEEDGHGSLAQIQCLMKKKKQCLATAKEKVMICVI